VEAVGGGGVWKGQKFQIKPKLEKKKQKYSFSKISNTTYKSE
jgi:hypothetical protein